MRKSKDNLKHRYLHKFLDDNICEIIFDVINNKLVNEVNWKDTPPNWKIIDEEYLLWSNTVSLNYEEILFDIYGPFIIDTVNKEIIVANEEDPMG